MSVPAYLTPAMLFGNAAIIVVAMAGLTLALSRAGWEKSRRRAVALGAAGTLGGWFAIALSLSYGEFYRGTAGRLPTVEFGLVIPIVIGLLALWRSKTTSSVLDIVPQSWIVGIQFYRVMGGVFILLYSSGHLPAQFAIPPGWGDLAIGLLAPVLAMAHARGLMGSGSAIRAWNIAGLLDLAVAVTTGFLTSPSPLQLLSLEAPNGLISAFPLVLVPVFAVPLAVLLHVASLMKLARPSAVAADAGGKSRSPRAGQ